MRWKYYCNFINTLIIVSMMHFVYSSAQENQRLESDILGLLPGQEKQTDWHQVSEPQFFDPDNLYEYINGAADLYLLYGFRRVLTTDYVVGKDSNTVNIEIYCMKSLTHAFGIYAAERSREEVAIDIGVQGYRGPNVLIFYKGPYYVKIMVFTKSEDLMNLVDQMGKLIADKIQGEFKEPEAFSFFPLEDKVQCSERYIPSSFLGQSYLQNGYRCDYKSDQDAYQIFLVPMESDTAAKAALKKYQHFLVSQDYKIFPQKNNNDMIAKKEHFVLAFASRSYFGGILQIKSLEQGQHEIAIMKNHLLDR